MKKKIVSILSIILFICLICSITYASETNVTLQKNKEKYTGGDVVEISVKINDIALENGIETIIGKMSYNKDLYESCIIEENNSWEADFNEENGKIILQRNEAIKENHVAFIIKLTIKENVVNDDTISFADINIADENTDLFPQNATTSITIENVITGGEEEPEGELQPETPSGNEGIGNTNTDKGANDTTDFEEIKEDDTKTENKMPNTGTFSLIGIMAVIAIFAAISLVKYNKYKGI